MLSALPDGLSRADGMTGVIIFAVVYAIVSIIAKAKQASQQRGGGDSSASEAEQQARQQRQLQQRQQQQQGQQRTQQPRQVRPPPPVQPRPGNTQSEGTRLEDLLRVLTEAAGGVPTTGGPVERQRPAPLPSDEDVEERESLETEEQVQSLEVETRRPMRKEVDFDDEAEAIVQRRIRSAQDRDSALSKKDHKAFDSRIRAVVPDNTRVARPSLASLKRAIVWREILGPPISLRKPSDPEF